MATKSRPSTEAVQVEHREAKEGAGASPGRAPGARGAFFWHLRTIGLSTSWFAAIIALVFLFIIVGLVELGSPPSLSLVPELPAFFTGYVACLVTASPIFFLILGMVMPSYLETLMGFGITRRQYALGLLAAGMLLMGALALVCTLGVMIVNQFVLPMPGFLNFILSCPFLFLIGWFIMIGYLCRSVIGAILTTMLGVLLVSAMFWPAALLESPMVTDGVVYLGLFTLTPDNAATVNLIIMLTIIAILIPTILVLTRRIPIKV